MQPRRFRSFAHGNTRPTSRNLQKGLNDRIGVHTDGTSEAERTRQVLGYCRVRSQAIAGLTGSAPWKLWAKYLFHFLISLAQVLGMSANDVFNAYVKQNEVTFKRQDSGYTRKDGHDLKPI